MEQRSLASAACPARSWAWALLGIQEQWELPVWSPEEWKGEKVCVRAGDTPPPRTSACLSGNNGLLAGPQQARTPRLCCVAISIVMDKESMIKHFPFCPQKYWAKFWDT